MKVKMDELISHHTGIMMSALSRQTIASTPYMILAMKSQKAMASVATFPARQCHGRTSSTELAEMKATGANSGYMTTMNECGEQRRIRNHLMRVFEAH